MPTLRESSMYPRSNLAPLSRSGRFVANEGGMQDGMHGAAGTPEKGGVSTMLPESHVGRSTLMHASMPVIAATYDSLTRQFYGNHRFPLTRILPPRRVF